MAKEISIKRQAELLSIAITNRARTIGEYLDTLEKMEKDINGFTAEQTALYRLCIRSIRMDVNSLATTEERERA
jgi:hypothetical protein